MIPRRFFCSQALLLACILCWPTLSHAQISFTSNLTEGCSPLIVNFTANAPGAIGYSWDLGNNTFSSQQNPSVTYVNGGLYSVTLTAAYADGSTQTVTEFGYIEVFDPPVPDFSAAPLALCSGNDVTFTNTSQPGSGPITGWTWSFGDGNTTTQQAPTHTYNLAGTFAVALIATDVNGCSATEQKSGYVQVNNTPSADFTANNTLSCTTPFTVNFSTISPLLATAHTWNLGNGATPITSSPTTTYNNTGQYTVTHIVTDTIGCADTVTKANYIQVGSPNIAFQVSKSAACQGEPITFSCGAAPGSIVSWNFGNGNSSTLCQTTISYGTPGTYVASISITDPSGCSYNASQPITIHPRPIVDFSLSDTLLCEAPHEVTLTSTGSAGSTYQWDFGDGTTGSGSTVFHTYPTLPVNSATGQPYFWDISLTVTNQFGCTASRTKSNALNTGRTEARVGVDSRTGCAPRLVDFTDVSISNSPIISWEWDFGVPGATSTLQSPDYTYLDTGAYDLMFVIETLHGCRDTFFAPGYIVAGDTPVADFIPDTTLTCASDPVQFFNLSTGADSASWIFGDGGTSTIWEPSYQFKDTGHISVMLIALDRGCPDTMFVDSLVFVDPPIAQFLPPNSIGCDTPFTVNFNDFSIGADIYTWDFGDGSPTSALPDPTHTYTTEGNFFPELIVENVSTGCRDTLGGSVFVETVKASFAVDTTFGCNPVKVNFSDLSNNAINWNWNFGNGNQSQSAQPTHVYDLPGQYDVSLTVRNSLNCVDDTTITQQVSVYEPQVAFQAAPTQGCVPLSVSFTNTTTSLAPVVTWQWSFGPSGGTSGVQAPTYVYTAPGSWDVILTATDSVGCTNQLAKGNEVFVSQPVADFLAVHPINCPNNPVVFSNTSTGSGLSYLWDFGDGNTSGAFNPTHTYTTPGIYTVSLTVTDFQGCDSTLTLSNYITIADPVISLTADSTNADCPPLVVNFTGNALSPHNFNVWAWDFGDGGTSAGQNPSHIYASPGTYTVQVTATAASGCHATFSASNLININGPTGSFTVTPTAACPNTPLTFTATSPDAAVFTWDFNNGVLGSGQTTTYVYTTSGIYLPLLILEDSAGCVLVVPNSQPVNIHPVPQASFNQSNSILCDSGTVAFSNTSVSTAPITLVNWDFGLGLGTSQANNPSFFFGIVGTYDVQLIVENNFGCRDTAFQPGLVVVGQPPNAEPSLSDTTGCAPFSVTFSDLSIPGSSPIASRQWTFSLSSPTFSSQANPTFIYTQPGVYTPVLEVTDQNGCTDTDTLTLESLAPPIADFTASDSFGCAPIDIQFQSLTPNITDWEWDFGDASANAFVANPLHSYQNDGTYSVSLAVTDSEGCQDTLIKPQYINLDHPVADFAISDTVICPNEPLQFTDLSQSDTLLTTWTWQFGNGDQSNQQNPVYSYLVAGLYEVSLKVEDVFGCEDSVSKPRTIRIRQDEVPVSPGIHVVTVESGSDIRVVFASYDDFRGDFGGYRLLREDGNGNWAPVFVSGNILDTVYVDGGLNTPAQRYCYRLEVLNHCGRASEFRESDIHCSILLDTEPLVDAIKVSWSPYDGWPVQAYEVYRVSNYNPNTAQLVATVGGNETSWVDLDMFCYDAFIYRVKAIPVDRDWESWSNIRREAPQHFGPPFPLNLVVATVEQDSFIQVTWGDVPPGEDLVRVLIERDIGNGFQAWHNQAVTDLQRQKVDADVDVDLRPYSYQAFVIDTCGDATPAGNIARTIHLTAKRQDGTVSLTWTPYELWGGGVERYDLELYDESQESFVLVTTLNGNQLAYIDRQSKLAQGSYCYRVTAWEAGGTQVFSHSNEACIVVDPFLYYPNAFSPNGDGHNDVFFIKGAYVETFTLEIYNRWGEKIFVTNNQAEGWDGRINNVPAPEGVYVYSVVGIGYEGEEVSRSGTVTLFR